MDGADETLRRHNWIPANLESELLEVSEDRRLRRLGIDPDLPQWEIYKELKKRAAQLETEDAEQEQCRGDEI
jgi:hypothetical protein